MADRPRRRRPEPAPSPAPRLISQGRKSDVRQRPIVTSPEPIHAVASGAMNDASRPPRPALALALAGAVLAVGVLVAFVSPGDLFDGLTALFIACAVAAELYAPRISGRFVVSGG